MRDFPGWHGWRAGLLGPLLTTIVAAVVDWLLRLEIAQKQGKQVPSREGNESTANRKIIRSGTRSQWSDVTERRVSEFRNVSLRNVSFL